MIISKSHELIKYIREYFLDSNDIDSKNLAIYLLDCSEIYIAIKERENERLEEQNKQLLDALNKLDDIFNVDKKGSIFDARKIITDTLNSISGKKPEEQSDSIKISNIVDNKILIRIYE